MRASSRMRAPAAEGLQELVYDYGRAALATAPARPCMRPAASATAQRRYMSRSRAPIRRLPMDHELWRAS